MLEVEFNSQDEATFIFHTPTEEHPVKIHLSGEEKLLYHLILDRRKIGSLNSELWDWESVSSLLDFLSSSSYSLSILSIVISVFSQTVLL